MMGAAIWWMLVLIGLLLMAWFGATQVKKQLTHDDPSSAPAGFTLAELRAMRAGGKISEQEFERAKEVVMDAARKATLAKSKPGPGQGPSSAIGDRPVE